MGERCNRTAEVRGSIPLSSTNPRNFSKVTQKNVWRGRVVGIQVPEGH